MKAIVHTRYGEPASVLRYTELGAPAAGDGEVLVRVRAAGIARGDWLIATGLPYIARPSYGLRTPKHPVAGQQLAGVVDTTGTSTAEFESGDEVFGWCNGAYAEYAAVDEGQLAPKPRNISFEQAASVPTSGCAALQAIRDRGQVQSGQHVLITGASGGVGTYAVQIAKAHGAEVTGVCSTRNVGMVRSIGADHVIDYTRDDIDRSRHSFDVIIDIAGNRSISTLRSVLTSKGILVIVGSTGGRITMGFGRTVKAMAQSPFVGQRLRPLISKPNQKDLEALKDLIEGGHVTPVIDETLALENVPEAVAQLGSGHSQGTRVVSV